jgi:hypothetical protein
MSATASVPTFRYRYGDVNDIEVPYTSGTGVSLGDMCYINNSNTLEPANQLSWSTSLTPTQGVFVASFCGVAQQTYNPNQANTVGLYNASVRCATNGVFAFDMDSGYTTPEVGDLVGPSKDTAGNFLMNQVVAKVSSEADAIGRVVSNQIQVENGVNRVLVRIYATLSAVNN